MDRRSNMQCNIRRSMDDRIMNACTCSRTAATSGILPGLFGVDCDYSYCPECIDNTARLCGVMYDNYTYLEDLEMPVLTASQIKKMTSCIQYIVGSSELVCMTTNFDYITLDITCTVTISGQQCSSCNIVKCASGIGSNPVNLSDINTDEIYDNEFLFDCSNIDGMYAFDECEYVPFTMTPSLELAAQDPLSFNRYTDETPTESCYKVSNTIQRDTNASGNASSANSLLGSYNWILVVISSLLVFFA
jgi:hypothetical protein